MMPALIFDCDGVLADTERDGHRQAFNATFAEMGLPICWSEAEYAGKLRIGGGKERMATLLNPDLVKKLGLPTDADGQRELLAAWHRSKTAHYTALVRRGKLPPRPGIARLAGEAAAAGWRLAVASTSAESAVRAVLAQAVGPLAGEFAVFAGDVVAHKKPAPDIYQLAVEHLGADARQTIAIEDSANGLAAARSAGLRTVVTISSYTADDDFAGAALVLSSLGDDHEPARLLADGYGIGPGPVMHLSDLQAVLDYDDVDQEKSR